MLEKFLVKKMVWKGARRGAQVGVGFAVSYLAKSYGIKISPEQEAAIVIAVTGGLESGINAAKQRFPSQIGWL